MYVAALLWEAKSSNLLQVALPAIRRKMQTKCIDFYMHQFSVTCLLTYYLSFWLLLNICLKKYTVLCKQA